MNDKLAIAAHILNGICAGDWKFDIKDSSWDEVAVNRSLELAQMLMDQHDRVDE